MQLPRRADTEEPSPDDLLEIPYSELERLRSAPLHEVQDFAFEMLGITPHPKDTVSSLLTKITSAAIDIVAEETDSQ